MLPVGKSGADLSGLVLEDVECPKSVESCLFGLTVHACLRNYTEPERSDLSVVSAQATNNLTNISLSV